ncbi:hypothetical protein J7I80_08145 [Bacillus sp. ISL-41]|uniref:hypothetical protein n=1 Tax=Bacillus sp. ISL-41 TaxID=2819127 RepID=UPI001BE967BF|nr:hypothetical protein [Bacillus sp. ISL-41]MBT2642192.1 hypothetical protein [Bacillus sp. ISL-41]
MDISEQLTTEKLHALLMNIYFKGIQSEHIQINEFIEEIKEQLLATSKRAGE